MVKFSGRKVSLGIGLEATRGTSVAPEYWYPHLDLTLNDKDTPLYNESGMGTIIKNNEKHTVLVEGEGTASGKMYIKGIYYFLALVFGQKATTTAVSGDTDAKSHKFSLLNSNQHLSATLALKEPNLDVRFPYVLPESFTITWSPGEYPKIEFPVKSRRSASAANTVAYIVDKEFLPKHAQLRIADDLAGLAGASALTDIKSFSITFNKTLETQQTMPTSSPDELTYSDIFNTDFEVTGSIEKLYNDTTYRGYALNDTIKAMQFSLIDPANLAGETTPTSLSIDLSRVAFDSREPAYGLSGISTETINFAMLLDTSDFSKSVQATLVSKYTYS